jgi:bifunctional non-homologous end joining protein LigD
MPGYTNGGFPQWALVELAQRLAPLARATSPSGAYRVEGVQWVRPQLVGEVAYREFTGRLRHQSWKGLIEPNPGLT